MLQSRAEGLLLRYYATCCKTWSTLIQNSSDATCLYGDKGVGCSDTVPEVCHLNTRFSCETYAAYPSPSSTSNAPKSPESFVTIVTPSNNSPSTASIDFPYFLVAYQIYPRIYVYHTFSDSCIHGGLLEYVSVWGKRLYLNYRNWLDLIPISAMTTLFRSTAALVVLMPKRTKVSGIVHSIYSLMNQKSFPKNFFFRFIFIYFVFKYWSTFIKTTIIAILY